MNDKNVFSLGRIPSNKARTQQAETPEIPPAETTAAAREFVEAAKTHSVPAPKRVPALDWRSLDPEERPTRGINVRFNEYELALLRYLAKREDRSIHQTIKRHLISSAQASAEERE